MPSVNFDMRNGIHRCSLAPETKLPPRSERNEETSVNVAAADKHDGSRAISPSRYVAKVIPYVARVDRVNTEKTDGLNLFFCFRCENFLLRFLLGS